MVDTVSSPDFSRRTFLERIALTAREPVFSAAFAWALDEESPLSLPQRNAILAPLYGGNPHAKSISAETEWNNIDLLLTIQKTEGRAYLAIENKIKAMEGPSQLLKYETYLKKLDGEVKRVFLSLSGEVAHSSPGWSSISYEEWFPAISAITDVQSPYFMDLCDALSRLVGAVKQAREDGNISQLVFGVKSNKMGIGKELIVNYIHRNKLYKLLQHVWMLELVKILNFDSSWEVKISESNGQALMNCQSNIGLDKQYNIGLQLQGHSLKLFCEPNPYPRKSTSEQDLGVLNCLEILRSKFNIEANVKPSPSRGRGFRSFTIKSMPRDNRDVRAWRDVLQPVLDKLFLVFPKSNRLGIDV